MAIIVYKLASINPSLQPRFPVVARGLDIFGCRGTAVIFHHGFYVAKEVLGLSPGFIACKHSQSCGKFRVILRLNLFVLVRVAIIVEEGILSLRKIIIPVL